MDHSHILIYSESTHVNHVVNIYTRKYVAPLPVFTTSPLVITSDTIGLVVICSPSANVLDPLTNPVTVQFPLS
jgi:hypothetical protein